MPRITFNIPEHIPTSATYEVNIDFDEASKAWRIHTAADNPRELRRRQRKYWREMKSAHPRRSRRLHREQYVTRNDPITARIQEAVLGYQHKKRRSPRTRTRVKRLIEEC